MLRTARKQVVASANKILGSGLTRLFARTLAGTALAIGSALAQPPSSFDTFNVPAWQRAA